MEQTKFLVIDTETGGLNPIQHSLLSIGMVVIDLKFKHKIVDELEMFIKPDDSVYKVDPAALAVNKINLVEHTAKALDGWTAIKKLDAFLLEHFGTQRIHLIGHNVGFDINFLKHYLTEEHIASHIVAMPDHPINDFDDFPEYWGWRFSHRSIDTMSIIKFLQLSEVMLRLQGDIGLQEALNYFEVEFDNSKRHTALGDARATAYLFMEMVERVRTSWDEGLMA